jgi:alpha-methylacyl-CoA racemase
MPTDPLPPAPSRTALPQGPLAGLRVIEMVGMGPGPFAAMWMADMGATVTRVDRPGERSEQTRSDVLNRGRRSLAVDLKQPGAAALVLDLIEQSDVLIEGFRPGVMERLGLGPDTCLQRNSRLVYGRVTGWGQQGPLAPRAGHDIDYIALTGVLAAIGPGDGRPTPPLNLVGDFGGGGMLLVAGVLAALFERSVSGRGQVVDAAMTDGAALLNAMTWGYHHQGAWSDEREANYLDGGAPYYGTYRCADGRYVAVGAIEPQFWTTFLDRCGIDDPELREHAHDRARWPALRERLAGHLLQRTRDQWCALLEDIDACVAPVLTMSEAPAHRHAVARSAYIVRDGVVQPAPAPRFSRTPGAVLAPPPRVGEHSEALLREHGFTAEQIAAWAETGVIVQAGDPHDLPAG